MTLTFVFQISMFCKVQLFWEDHKNSVQSSSRFSRYLVMSKPWGRLCQIFVSFSEKLNFTLQARNQTVWMRISDGTLQKRLCAPPQHYQNFWFKSDRAVCSCTIAAVSKSDGKKPHLCTYMKYRWFEQNHNKTNSVLKRILTTYQSLTWTWYCGLSWVSLAAQFLYGTKLTGALMTSATCPYAQVQWLA